MVRVTLAMHMRGTMSWPSTTLTYEQHVAASVNNYPAAMISGLVVGVNECVVTRWAPVKLAPTQALYSDEEVAHRNVKVGHGATEKGP
jgi:hypothetical protein